MPESFDIVIENGKVIDGTGNPSFHTDIGICGDRITALDNLKDASASRRIDAVGMTVCPGFVDAHCHTDAYAEYYPNAEGKVMQGITTDVCGLCGGSAAPVGEGHIDEYRSRNLDFIPEEKFRRIDPVSFDEYLRKIDLQGNATNMALFAGNGNLRTHAVGYEDRLPSSSELSEMKNLLRRCMEEGAFGLSSGLTYVPSMFASMEELLLLCEVMKPYGGIYDSHMRNESDRVVESVEEVIGIARKSGCRGHISHLKVMGKQNRGKAEKCLELIEEANKKGVAVTFDVYPYTAGSTALKTLLPGWVLSKGFGDFSVLENERERILKDLESGGWDNISLSCGYEGIFVSSAGGLSEYEGKSLAGIADELGTTPYDAIVKVLRDTSGQAEMIYHSMSEEDVRMFLKSEYCVLGTDAYARHYRGPTAYGTPHPRNYGAFPRYLRRYVLESKLLGQEEGIRKITGLPSRIFGLKDRGILAPGNYADISVVNFDSVADTATWEKPAQKPKGIDWVLINGKVAVEQGTTADIRPGKGLRHG